MNSLHNAVGERTADSFSGGTNTYHWWLGFLVEYESSAGAGLEVLNLYRADGMRVWRRSQSGSTAVVTRSDYDGQMPVFERQFNNGIQQWKRYNALGARGIDGWHNSASSSWHYPIYDVHGNVNSTVDLGRFILLRWASVVARSQSHSTFFFAFL